MSWLAGEDTLAEERSARSIGLTDAFLRWLMMLADAVLAVAAVFAAVASLEAALRVVAK